MPLVTIIGSSTGDSYVTLTEANEYIASRPDTLNWNNSDFLERERLLRQAAIDIDVFRIKGHKLFRGGEGGGYETVPSLSYYDVLSYGFQRLQFPRTWQEHYVGYAESGNTTTLVDSYFVPLPREDDYFKYGAIYIIEGTNEGESRAISAYDEATGTFTVDPAFSSAIDTTSRYIILAPVDRYVKYAQTEQALFLSNSSELLKFKEWQAAGIIARRIGDVSIRFKSGLGSMDKVAGFVSANSFRYLQKFIDRNFSMGRS